MAKPEDLQFFIDPNRCIGCQACVQACSECDTHRGESMIHLEYVNRPLVRVISDNLGMLIHPGFTADLAEKKDEGHFARSIIKVSNPDKYGVRVSDYFV